MKNQLTALCIAMPLLFAAAQSHAEYVFKFPMEEATGGTLPNGSIIIVKNAVGGGVVVPPVIPEPDPLEPENPACDPFDSSSKHNEVGKEVHFTSVFKSLSKTYRACEIKKTDTPNLLAKFIDGISEPWNDGTVADTCKIAVYNEVDKSMNKCHVDGMLIKLTYEFTKDSIGNYAFKPFKNNATIIVNRDSVTTPIMTQVKRMVINGVECESYSGFAVWYTRCTYNVPYESLAAMTGKPFVVELYK